MLRIVIDRVDEFNTVVYETFTYTYANCNPSQDVYGNVVEPWERFFCPTVQATISADTHLVYGGGVIHVGVSPFVGPDNLPEQRLDTYFGGDNWVIPYNGDVPCASPDLNCGTHENPFLAQTTVFITPQALPDITFADEADTKVPAGRTFNWTFGGNLDDVTLRFPEGRRLAVLGDLNVGAVTLREADALTGWSGVAFEAGSSGTLTGVTVQGVLRNAIGRTLPSAAVTAYDAAVTIGGGSRIAGSDVDGLRALGSQANVIVTGESVISGHSKWGVLAGAGAEATIEGGSVVKENLGGGVLASGTGTTVHLDGAVIRDNDATGTNEAYGVRARDNGEVRFASLHTDAYTEILFNDGGLDANTGGLLDAGTCETLYAPCPQRTAHEIVGNTESGVFYDARSRNGAVLYAQGNDWGVPSVADLRLLKDTASGLYVEPIVPSGSRLGGAVARAEGTPEGAGSGTWRGDSTSVLGLVDGAARAYLAGDLPDAFAHTDAASTAASQPYAGEDERRAAFEAAARLVAAAQPAQAVAALEGAAGEPGPSRPWALRALATAYAAGGRAADARATAATLAADYPGGEHALFGLALGVRVEVEAADEAAALAALAALASADPEGEPTAEAAALVQAAFPGADVTGVLNGATAPFASSASKGTGAGVPSGASVLVLGEARPNPAAGRAVVPFVLGEAAAVEAVLYDALGRRVAVVASGTYAAGAHAARVEASELPAGVYVVHVTARPLVGGRAAVAVSRLTFTR